MEFASSLCDESANETWKPLEDEPLYLISSWGRVKHLKSYGNKSRILCITLKMNKYPYFTISIGNQRKGYSLIKVMKKLYGSQCPKRN